MGALDPTQEEYNLIVSMITEAVRLRGTSAKLYQVETETFDQYRAPDYIRLEAVDVGLLFEENPKPILKKNGWYVDGEDMPYVAYMTTRTVTGAPVVLREGMLIEVPSVYGMVDKQTFQVTGVKGVTIDPVAWICKMVPHRKKLDQQLLVDGVQTSRVEPNAMGKVFTQEV